jgi:hypothetical protein
MATKEKTLLRKELIGSCGINCAVCARYLAREYDVKSKGISIPYCEGCGPGNRQCATLKKKCDLLMKGSVTLCYECDKFPCANLERLDGSYRKFFKTGLIDNLREIKAKGMDAFLKSQREKYRCSRCGGIMNIHTKKCFVCDIKTMKKKGELGAPRTPKPKKKKG